MTSIRLTSCAMTAHRPGAQHKIPALTTSPDSLKFIERSRPAVMIYGSARRGRNEASDVAFPGRIAPAFKARASPADQSGRGKGHRLPCRVGTRASSGLSRVGASTRLPLRSTQIRSGSPVLTAPSKVKLPVYSVPLTCHRAFTLVAVLSSTPERLCCRRWLWRAQCAASGPPRGIRRCAHRARPCPAPRTCGGDQSNQDSERDNQQFEPVAGTHQRIAAARAQKPPYVDIFDTLHDHSLVETRGSPAGDGCVGCGVVVGDPELIG